MAARPRITCLAVLTLCCVSADCLADELPTGVWKARAAGDTQGELVVKSVKDGRDVEGSVFGKPFTGVWYGNKLVLNLNNVDRPESWEGWLVKEQRDKRIRYTLAGVRKVDFRFAGWLTAGGWYAQIDLPAHELPKGVWKVRAAEDLHGELVIKTLKADGSVEGSIFGKPLTSSWDGTRLSFKFGVENWYEGWLVQEKRGEQIRYTLTGVRRQLTVFSVSGWHEAGGWYAQRDVPAKK